MRNFYAKCCDYVVLDIDIFCEVWYNNSNDTETAIRRCKSIPVGKLYPDTRRVYVQLGFEFTAPWGGYRGDSQEEVTCRNLMKLVK